ncbi:hypothetical protein [Flavobacterium sp. JP2137]|uniref:hypothetical protein n=1 Tax=Flavobacterium sp. JP2137 TaxID=3414510 RepID=UPI003D2FC2B8
MPYYFRLTLYGLTLFFCATIFYSCKVVDTAKSPARTLINKENNEKIHIERFVLTIDLSFPDSQTIPIADKHHTDIVLWIEAAVYDAKWNDSGIMVKMRSPDFTLNIKSEFNNHNQIFIWKDGGKIKVNSTWYILDSPRSQKLGELLELYRVNNGI